MAQAISAQAAVPASRPEKKVRDAASSRCVLAGPWPSRATMHGIGAVAAAAGSWAPATPQLGIRRGVDQLLRCCGPAHVAAVARGDEGEDVEGGHLEIDAGAEDEVQTTLEEVARMQRRTRWRASL